MRKYKKRYAIFLFVLSIIFLITFYRVKVIPNKLYFLFVIADLFAYCFLIYLINRKQKMIRRIGFLVSLMFLVISFIGIKDGIATIKFFDKSFNNQKYEISNFKILTLNNKNINSINDLVGKKIGYLSYLDEKIFASIEIEFIKLKEDNFQDLYDKLINNKIDALILEDVYLDILNDDYMNFNFKDVYSFEIKEDKKKKAEVKLLKPINIYISGGSSKYNKLYNKTKSNINMLVTINPYSKKVILTSIPKNYYVEVFGKNGFSDKLSNSGLYGLETSSKTVEKLLNTDVDYSIKVNFLAVSKIIDILGGIDIISNSAFTTLSSDHGAKIVNVNVGKNHFNGSEAISYARDKSEENKNQNTEQQIFRATLDKVLNNKKILLNYENILTSLNELYITDIPESFVKLLVKEQISNMKSWNFISQSLIGNEERKYTYTNSMVKSTVIIPDYKNLEESQKQIKSALEEK